MSTFIQRLTAAAAVTAALGATATPASADVVLSMTRYGSLEFCSSVQKDNIFGCQFHPERSGQAGLTIYKNLASRIQSREQQRHD